MSPNNVYLSGGPPTKKKEGKHGSTVAVEKDSESTPKAPPPQPRRGANKGHDAAVLKAEALRLGRRENAVGRGCDPYGSSTPSDCNDGACEPTSWFSTPSPVE